MATAMELTAEQRNTLNAAYKIGSALNRKFEHMDLAGNSTLMQAARIYAISYTGDFSYMVEMRAEVSQRGGLSVGQAKGVLNVMMADARRKMADRTLATAVAGESKSTVTTADYSRISKGRFTIVFDANNPSDSITVEIDKWDGYTDRRTGVKRTDVRTIKYLAGPDNTADYIFAGAFDGTRVLFSKGASRAMRALELLAISSGEDQAKMGAAYAFAASQCWRCGRQLTVEDSVAGGIGPVCAGKVEAEYGTGTLQAAKEAMARLKETEPIATPTPKPEEDRAAQISSTPTRDPNIDYNWAPDSSATPKRLDRARTYEEIFGDDD